METNEIKRVPFADEPIGDGSGGSEITMAFTENYYLKNDTFMVDETRQLFFVVAGPVRKNDAYWELLVRILDDNYNSTLDDSISYIGATTRWIGNAFPELHEYGKLYMLFSAIKEVLVA